MNKLAKVSTQFRGITREFFETFHQHFPNSVKLLKMDQNETFHQHFPNSVKLLKMDQNETFQTYNSPYYRVLT